MLRISESPSSLYASGNKNDRRMKLLRQKYGAIKRRPKSVVKSVSVSRIQKCDQYHPLGLIGESHESILRKQIMGGHANR